MTMAVIYKNRIVSPGHVATQAMYDFDRYHAGYTNGMRQRIDNDPSFLPKFGWIRQNAEEVSEEFLIEAGNQFIAMFNRYYQKKELPERLLLPLY